MITDDSLWISNDGLAFNLAPHFMCPIHGEIEGNTMTITVDAQGCLPSFEKNYCIRCLADLLDKELPKLKTLEK